MDLYLVHLKNYSMDFDNALFKKAAMKPIMYKLIVITLGLVVCQ